MSVSYAHRFSGHNLGPEVVDLGVALGNPGSVRGRGNPGILWNAGETCVGTECLHPRWQPTLTPQLGVTCESNWSASGQF